jgi:L-2-hydroxycarboxylate dehydrogenase (NAD+)
VPHLTVGEIRIIADRVLARAGVPELHAAVQRDLLIEAELRGAPSHGLLRLPRIIARIRNGVIDPEKSGAHTWRAEAFLAVDGEMGLGPVVALTALDALVEKVHATGVAMAAIRNSNHLGALSFYADRIARGGKTLLAFSTSEALVHPWGGRLAMLGTNPIAIGIPTETDPFVMDTATSLVSMGKIHDHANRGEPIPANWALDENGDPTTDPNRAKKGAIAPFGDAKGYALGLAFELLVSSLAGAALGRDVKGTLDTTEICSKGDLFIVIDGPQAHLAAYLQAIRDLEPAQGFTRVLVPGDRARATREERLETGIPVADSVWSDLLYLAGETSERRISA